MIVLPVEDCARLFNSYYKGQKDPFNLSQILHLIDYHTIMIELLAKAANMEEWSIEELLRKLIDHGFHMSDEAVEGHHEKLRNENSLINQLIILFSIMNYSDTFKSLLEQVSVIPAIPFHFDSQDGLPSKRSQTWKKWFAQVGCKVIFSSKQHILCILSLPPQFAFSLRILCIMIAEILYMHLQMICIMKTRIMDMKKLG